MQPTFVWRDVLRAMHKRYAKSWYETLTFTRRAQLNNADGTSKAETWHEVLALRKIAHRHGAPNDATDTSWSMEPLTILKAGRSRDSPLVNMLLCWG